MEGVKTLHPDARAAVEHLGLQPHPEGGFYVETWRSPVRVPTARGERAAMTVIHFLLPEGAFSAFHRVHADEAWHHVDGAPVELHVLAADGSDYRLHRLGPWRHEAHRSHVVVPAGAWQAARPVGTGFALVSCTVAPGFDFEDFEMADRDRLPALRPDLAPLIADLCLPAR